MWDTGCSLPGLITLTKFEEWKERFGMKLKHEKWYEKGKEISGMSADNPVMMMGTVVFEFSRMRGVRLTWSSVCSRVETRARQT